jgi:hypothetical protein
MAIYSLGARTSIVGSGTAGWEARSAATDLPRVMELGVFLAAATASTIGLGRPAAIGITPTTPVTVLAEDPNDPAGTVLVALAWATPPTIPGAFFRRISLPATIGTGIFWTFPRGLKIPVSGLSSIILWNLAANGVQDVHVVVDE